MTAKSGATLLVAIERVVSKIGTPDGYNGTRVPRINDPQSAAVLEYAVAKTLKSHAEEREKAARAAIMSTFADQISEAGRVKGRIAIHQSPYATLDVQVISGQTRLDRPTLIREMCKEFGTTPEKAQALLDLCSTKGEPQIRLSPTVVQIDE